MDKSIYTGDGREWWDRKKREWIRYSDARANNPRIPTFGSRMARMRRTLGPTIVPVRKRPQMGDFMAKISRALRTKTGQKQPKTARTIYGLVVGHLSRRSLTARAVTDTKQELIEWFDYLPREREATWYVSAMRAHMTEILGDARKRAGGKCRREPSSPDAIGDILSRGSFGAGSAESNSLM